MKKLFGAWPAKVAGERTPPKYGSLLGDFGGLTHKFVAVHKKIMLQADEEPVIVCILMSFRSDSKRISPRVTAYYRYFMILLFQR